MPHQYNHQSTSVHHWRLSDPKILIDPKTTKPAHHQDPPIHQHLKPEQRDPNMIGHPRDVWHLPPKQCAASFRNWKKLLVLLNDPNDTTPTPSSLLHDACIHGAPPIVLTTIISKLDQDSHWAESLDGAKNNPLHSAILCHQWTDSTDQESCVRLLLKTFPDACLHRNINGSLPIHLAASNKSYTIDGHVGETHGKHTKRMSFIVEMLVATNVSTCKILDYTGHTPLALACNAGHANSVSVLVDADPLMCQKTDTRGDLPIANLAFVAGSTKSNTEMKTALTKMKNAYPMSIHYNDRRKKAPIDYVMQKHLEEEVKILSPRIQLDSNATKRRFHHLLFSKFRAGKAADSKGHREDTRKNFHSMIDSHHYTPPVLDTMFHSKKWIKPKNCAPSP